MTKSRDLPYSESLYLAARLLSVAGGAELERRGTRVCIVAGAIWQVRRSIYQRDTLDNDPFPFGLGPWLWANAPITHQGSLGGLKDEV